MPVAGDYECFSDDWRRTNPDLVFFLPKQPPRFVEAVDHVLVDVTPGGDLLAVWTYGAKADASDQTVRYARSEDGGRTWSEPGEFDPPGPKYGQVACFGFPVTSRAGRIYVFYNKATAAGTAYTTCFLRCSYSDDDGRTWTPGKVDIPYRRTLLSHPDPSVGADSIVWQKPIRDARDRLLVGFTEWSSPAAERPLVVRKPDGTVNIFNSECRCQFMRFDNIDEGPEPRDVRITWLPDSEELISAPITADPDAPADLSFCQEPAVALLPDDHLFTVMRTRNGQIWYTVSDDHGHSWRPTEMLRFKDGGAPMENPVSPAPLYRLQDGRYLQLLQNHDGWGYGAKGPTDSTTTRRPQFIALGEYRPGAHQPIWFSDPKLLFDTAGVGVPPFYRSWLSMYASLTERNGERIFWYSDRRLFGLGRFITDEMLAGMTVPARGDGSSLPNPMA